MHARRSVLWAMVAMLSGGPVCLAGGGHEKVFKGEISDSQCATNVHSASRSHAEMLKTKMMGTTAADCTRLCVKNLGGVYVLQAKDKVYKVDNQYLAEKSAGQKVKVTGVLDLKSNTITVRSIEPIE